MRILTVVTVAIVILVTVAATDSRLSIIVLAAAAVSSSGLSSGRGPQHCEPIVVESCRDIGYNVTSMPNLVGDETQDEAERQYSTYHSLIQYGCSPKLKLFLCSVYFPMCSDKVPKNRPPLIGPCRKLCLSVRSSCEPVINRFGFPWPPGLECQLYPPANDDEHMCMEGDSDSSEQHQPSDQLPQSNLRPPSAVGNGRSSAPSTTATFGQVGKVDGHCVSGSAYVNRSWKCMPLCESDAAYNGNEKHFVEVWIAVWVSLCIVSTTFALLTSIISSDRWISQVPSAIDHTQRVLVIMSFCFAVHSVGYIIRLGAGRRAAACGLETASSMAAAGRSDDGALVESGNVAVAAAQRFLVLLVDEGLRNTDCAVIFVLNYYFSMAGWIWWTIATCRWMTTRIVDISSLQASAERDITSRSDRSCGGSLDSRGTGGSSSTGNALSKAHVDRTAGPMHAIAWSMSGILTIIALVLRSVGTDELTGVCLIDWSSTPALVVGPLSVCAGLSTIFFVIGIAATVRHRSYLRRRSFQLKHENVEISELSSNFTPMTPLPGESSGARGSPERTSRSSCSTLWSICWAGNGLSLVVLFVPVVLLISFSLYEYARGGVELYANRQQPITERRPLVSIVAIRAVLTLMAGTVVGLATVWNTNTASAWRKVIDQLRASIALRCEVGGQQSDRKVVLNQPARHQNGPSSDIKMAPAAEIRLLTTSTQPNADERRYRHYHHHHYHQHSRHYGSQQHQHHHYERQCECGRHDNVMTTGLYECVSGPADRKQKKLQII